MKFKKFYKLYLESIEDEILSQKGEYHLSSGNDNRFFGNAGAGILVYCVKTKRFLLGFRSKLVNEPNTWGTFGGKIDNDADPKAAARRELKEETGYNGNIDIQLFDVFQSGNFKFYNFLGKVEEEFEPREKFSYSLLMDRIKNQYPEMKEDYINDVFKNMGETELNTYLWPEQIKDAIEFFKNKES